MTVEWGRHVREDTSNVLDLSVSLIGIASEFSTGGYGAGVSHA
jgi:hypothetical protein